MKLLPLQKELLGRIFKDERILSQETEKVHYFTDGLVIWAIPKHECLIKHDKTTDMCEKMMTRDDYTEELFDSGDRKIVGKTVVIVLKTADGRVTWINEKLLKHFEEPTLFQGENSIDPILIKESGKPVGLVLPIRRSEE